MDEFIKAVVEHFEEEMEDICEYLHLAKKARNDDHGYLALLFSTIARDEYTHASHLRDYLIMEDVYQPEGAHKDLEAKWQKVSAMT